MKIKNFTIEVADPNILSILIQKYFPNCATEYLEYIDKEFMYLKIGNSTLKGVDFKYDNHFTLDKDTYPFICDFYENMIKTDDNTIEINKDSKPITITAQEFAFMFKQNPPPFLRRGQWFMAELAKINPRLYEDVSQTDLDCFAKHIIPVETMDYVTVNWNKFLNENTSKTIEQKYHDLLEENTKLKQIIYNIKNLVQ